MTTSKTIAALLGPTLVTTAAMILLNLDAMPLMIEQMSRIPILIILSGYAAFVPGIAIVYFHNRWVAGWPVLITVFGWLAVVIGLVRMVFATQLATVVAQAAVSPVLDVVLLAIGAVFLLVGGVLSFKAYLRE